MSDLDPELSADPVWRAKAAQANADYYAGKITLNQLRATLGLPLFTFPAADEFYTPMEWSSDD